MPLPPSNRLSRRRLLAALALSSAGVAAGCGPQGGTAPAPAAPAPAAPAPAASPVSAAPAAGAPAAVSPAAAPAAAPAVVNTSGVKTLNWWITTPGFMENLAKDYAAKTGINVVVQPQGNYDQMVQKVQAGIAANSLPHLAVLGQRHGIPQIADSGKLIPLADLMQGDASFDEKDFLPAFWKKFTYNGKIQTTPFINSSPVLHYNRTMFTAAGLDPDKPPTTHDELLAAAKALTKREGQTVTQWGLNTEEDSAWYLYAMIWQKGGALVGDDGKPKFNDAAGVAALSFWRELVHTHKVMPPIQHKAGKEDFAAGKYAMLFSSSSATGGFERDIGGKFEYSIARFPGDKLRAVPVGGASLGVFRSDSATEKAAWEFVKWLTSPEMNARISRETGYVAIRSATLNDPEMRDYLDKNPRRATAIRQIREDIRAESISPADSVIWNGFVKALEQIEADPALEPKKVLDDLAAETEKFLKEY